MRIGIFDPYLDDIGGGEKYMLTLASCLAENHEVSLFWNSEKDLQDVSTRFRIPIDKITLKENLFSPKVQSYKRFFGTKDYDALIILSDGSIPLVFSKKIYLHIQQPLQMQPQKGLKDALKLKRISKIFYNSKFTADFNNHLFPGVPSTIIYPPVDLVAVQTVKKNQVLHVGRYRIMEDESDFKKQHVMIEAFKSLVDAGLKNWEFILVAAVLKKDEKSFKEFEELAKGYPIKIVTNVSGKKLEEIYASAKIYWHASGFGEDLKKHPEFAEHFGISTVEAMSAGAVPIVINAGGQREIVTHEKDGLLWNSIDELKMMTMNVIQNANLLKKLSEASTIRAKSFSKERFAGEVFKLMTD